MRVFKETMVRVPRRRLSRLYELIRRAEGPQFRRFDVNLVFTTDRRMKALNRQYRRKDRSTDVLSFTIDDGAANSDFLGEIYVSVPTARRQARACGATLDDEHLRLTCHGLLHLVGYDHHRPADEREMKEREVRYLSQVSL